MYAKFKRADEAGKVCFVNPLHVCGVQETEHEYEVAGEPDPLTYLATTISTLSGSYFVEETPEEVAATLETCAASLLKGHGRCMRTVPAHDHGEVLPGGGFRFPVNIPQEEGM